MKNTSNTLQEIMPGISYWEYIQTDVLLSLQNPKTDFEDEQIFIMYHQVTELIFKMIIHELRQLVESPYAEDKMIDKLDRVNRYTELLTTSFSIMKHGMDYQQYDSFRKELVPASGFQSAQFRHIEIYCTRITNLVSKTKNVNLGESPSVEASFEYLYWKDAGLDKQTGEKTPTLRSFEEKHEKALIQLAKDVRGKTIEDMLLNLPITQAAILEKLKRFDYLYNVKWPLVHLETAAHYLDSRGENKPGTGGSEWKKYLHPKHQKRSFFPSLWDKCKIYEWTEASETDLYKNTAS
ncbi:MAG: tryptophan 2,3-dioxygenase family protein [Cyclobacteriaceae bacterium]